MNEQTIFLAALDIADLCARAAHLDKACAGNALLRQQVAALLSAHERSGAFLDVPAYQQIAPQASHPAKDTLNLEPVEQGNQPVAKEYTRSDTLAEPNDDDKDAGALNFLQPSTKPGSLGRLAQYEVLEVLGQGGFGTVVRAFDEKLQRVVAIKLLSPQMAATSPPRKRFLREARASAKIRHENVVAIHDIQEQPIPYLVMEYIPGETLQQKLDRVGPFEVTETLRLGQQIAAGLAAAHAQGLIHRDIKPANILLESALVSRVKITDFGLARAADDASLTQSGMIAGTPMYMAPEQAQGIVLDHRADLFSFGSVLYVMCSGRPPFRATTSLAVLKRVAEDTPRPIREIVAEIPQWLCAVITRLHAKKPQDRFGSAQEVADLLGRYLAEVQLHGKVQEAGGSNQESAKANSATETTLLPRPAVRRQRRWIPVAAALVVLALVGLGLTEATGVTNVVQGTIIRLFTSEGTLIVQVDDPEVSVTIEGEEIVIKGSGTKEIRVKAGQYKVQASKDGKVVQQELVTVTKNGRQVVRISREVAPVAPAAQGAPDRRAAEYVLSIGGTVKVNKQDTEIKVAADLPPGVFRLTWVVLAANQQVSDAGLAHFKDCKHLTDLWLHSSPQVGDAGLAYFKDCKNLVHLSLSETKVSDAGLVYFKDCKNLWVLYLGLTQVGDAGLAHFKDCKQLRYLYLNNTQVSDAGLAYFKDCKQLLALNLVATQVSDAGLANFKDCKHLTILYLEFEQVSDAGLVHFKDCKSLTVLSLYGKQVSDAGLAYFKDCKNLTHLSLPHTLITDAGLAQLKEFEDLTFLDLRGVTRVTNTGLNHLKACKSLNKLIANNTQVNDRGLVYLKDCKKLTYIDLKSTKVTAGGIDELAKALPLCLIEWDGSVVKPGKTKGT